MSKKITDLPIITNGLISDEDVLPVVDDPVGGEFGPIHGQRWAHPVDHVAALGEGAVSGVEVIAPVAAYGDDGKLEELTDLDQARVAGFEGEGARPLGEDQKVQSELMNSARVERHDLSHQPLEASFEFGGEASGRVPEQGRDRVRAGPLRDVDADTRMVRTLSDPELMTKA